MCLTVAPITSRLAREVVEREHYLHRKPPVSYAFGLYGEGPVVLGVVTFGTPASAHLVRGVVGVPGGVPSLMLELNRLWVADPLPRNTESWFVSRALRALPPAIVVSYADTAYGHQGYVYRALNFHYAGWTDMERATPRHDYVRVGTSAGGHSRDAFRAGGRVADGGFERVPRSLKVRYWTTTGNRAERRALERACLWPKMDWTAAVVNGLRYMAGLLVS